MPVRTAEATWEGDLLHGQGSMKAPGGAAGSTYSHGSRMEEEPGSNPEEMIGAAHAGCFSMALAACLSRAGHQPRRIHTAADVHLDPAGAGFRITRIRLRTEAVVPGLDETTFRQLAETARKDCPVSQALAGTEIELEARLRPVSAPVETAPPARAAEEQPASERGERLDTGKTIARGGKTTGHVPGATEQKP